MHVCKFIGIMLAFFSGSSALSCSVKEDRSACPCRLDIRLPNQPEGIFPEDRAWCSVWEGGEELAGGVVSTPVAGGAVTLCRAVRKNPNTVVVISNIEQKNGRIISGPDSEMDRLYVSCRAVDCSGESASVEADSFLKQFVNVTFFLNADAMPLRERLTLTLDGLYDGVSIPSLEPHRGTFSCTSEFDLQGSATIRIPPQGGPGLRVGICLDNRPSAETDLYRAMARSGFDWNIGNLPDFKTELGLNGVSGIIEFVDWDIVVLENKRF